MSEVSTRSKSLQNLFAVFEQPAHIHVGSSGSKRGRKDDADVGNASGSGGSSAKRRGSVRALSTAHSERTSKEEPDMWWKRSVADTKYFDSIRGAHALRLSKAPAYSSRRVPIPWSDVETGLLVDLQKQHGHSEYREVSELIVLST